MGPWMELPIMTSFSADIAGKRDNLRLMMTRSGQPLVAKHPI